MHSCLIAACYTNEIDTVMHPYREERDIANTALRIILHVAECVPFVNLLFKSLHFVTETKGKKSNGSHIVTIFFTQMIIRFHLTGFCVTKTITMTALCFGVG